MYPNSLSIHDHHRTVCIDRVSFWPACCFLLLTDMHMMVSRPEQWVKPMAAAGASQYTFHLEATTNPGNLIKEIRESNMKVCFSTTLQLIECICCFSNCVELVSHLKTCWKALLTSALTLICNWLNCICKTFHVGSWRICMHILIRLLSVCMFLGVNLGKYIVVILTGGHCYQAWDHCWGARPLGWTGWYGSGHDCRAWVWWPEIYGRHDAKGESYFM